MKYYKHKIMELKKLKKGDRIKIKWGYDEIRDAKVIENFPDKEKLYIRVNIGLWGLISSDVIRSYHEYNFELLRD